MARFRIGSSLIASRNVFHQVDASVSPFMLFAWLFLPYAVWLFLTCTCSWTSRGPKVCFIEMVSLLSRLQQLGRVVQAGSSLHFNVKLFCEPLGRLTPAA